MTTPYIHTEQHGNEPESSDTCKCSRNFVPELITITESSLHPELFFSSFLLPIEWLHVQQFRNVMMSHGHFVKSMTFSTLCRYYDERDVVRKPSKIFLLYQLVQDWCTRLEELYIDFQHVGLGQSENVEFDRPFNLHTIRMKADQFMLDSSEPFFVSLIKSSPKLTRLVTDITFAKLSFYLYVKIGLKTGMAQNLKEFGCHLGFLGSKKRLKFMKVFSELNFKCLKTLYVSQLWFPTDLKEIESWEILFAKLRRTATTLKLSDTFDSDPDAGFNGEEECEEDEDAIDLQRGLLAFVKLMVNCLDNLNFTSMHKCTWKMN